MARNKIRPIPPSLPQQRAQQPRIGHIIFQESDGYNLPGINPATNNYSPFPPIPPEPPTPSTYYLAVDGLDYYDVENGSTYYNIE